MQRALLPLFLAVLASTVAPPVRATTPLPPPILAFEDDPAEAPPPREVSLDVLELDVVLPPLEERRTGRRGIPQILEHWTGKLDGIDVAIHLRGLPREQFQLDEPDLVIDLVIQNVADRGSKEQWLRFAEMKLVPGEYGETPYAATVIAEVLEGTGRLVGETWYVSGISKDYCYVFEITIDAQPTPAVRKALDEFIAKGIKYRGEQRDRLWTKDETDARWEKEAPVELHDELDKILRTDNYIIFTNSAGAKAFSRAMEENYAAIKKMYPFREVEGRRLMPVFLFRMNTEYYEFLMKKGWSRAMAAQTKGVASQDWYATWYEAPKDSVHIHEATHQIFRNRLLLSGGGSWFQEGVAEFMERHHHNGMNEVENFGRAVARRGAGVPLKELFRMASLVFSSEQGRKSGGSAAGDAYTQSASVIAFVKNDKRTKAKFQEFIKEMGSVRRSDLPAIERALQRLFGWDLEAFEAAWKEHYK